MDHEPKPPQIIYIQLPVHNPVSEQEAMTWAREFLQALQELAQFEQAVNAGPSLQAQMQGEDIPHILDLICNAKG